MASFTSAELYGAKLAKVAAVAVAASPQALRARALVTKQSIVGAAHAQTRMAKDNWVRYRVVGETAEVRLRGGFAFLAEKGSHRHPSGWTERPRRRGVQALNTPYGPVASIRHGPLRARPFWHEGIAASRLPGFRAYEKVHQAAIRKAL